MTLSSTRALATLVAAWHKTEKKWYAESVSGQKRKAHRQKMVNLISLYVLASVLDQWEWSIFHVSKSG